MLRPLAPPVLLSAVLLLAGCGVSADGFCAEYFMAQDARAVRCGGGTGGQYQVLAKLADTCGDYRRALAGRTALFDASTAQACLDALKSGDCGTSRLVPAVCREAFSGVGAAGATCHADFECARGLFCDSVLGTPCPGTCRSYAAGGADCSGSALCLPELVCDTSRTPMTCVTPAAVGQACGASAHTSCAEPLFCGGDSTCHAQQTSGACTSQAQCQDRYRCSGGQCVARKGKGQACTDGQHECEQGLACNGGSCVPFATVGNACAEATTSSDGLPCAEGYCDSSTKACKGFKGAGDACTPFSLECGLVLCGADGKCPAGGGVCHVN